MLTLTFFLGLHQFLGSLLMSRNFQDLFKCEKIIEKFNGQPLTDPNNINKSTVSTLKS